MEFEDAWLEVSSCASGDQAASADHTMLDVPAISEVLEVAASTKMHQGMWYYSRRLNPAEIEVIQNALIFIKTAEDDRSVSYSAVVAYKGSCYILTLFTVKRS